MIARIALAVVAGLLYVATLKLERELANTREAYATAAAEEAEKRRAQLQAQAEAYGAALAEAQAQRQRLAARNDSLNRQLREVHDYANRLADSLRLYLNRMLNVPTDPAGWPIVPANPEERTDTPAPAAADPTG